MSVRYRIHTQLDPLATEGVLFLERGRRPNMRDYEGYAARITEEYGLPVTAIYETWHPTLHDNPVLETVGHNEARFAVRKANAELREKLRCLHHVGGSWDRLGDYMESYRNNMQRKLAELDTGVTEVRRRSRINVNEAAFASVVDSFVENSTSNYNSYLGNIARYEAELAYTLSSCYSVANEFHSCDRPYFVVEVDPERAYEEAEVFCVNCKTKVSFPKEAYIPLRDTVLAAHEEAA